MSRNYANVQRRCGAGLSRTSSAAGDVRGCGVLVGMLVLIAGVAITQVLAVVGVIVDVAGFSVMTVVAGSC